MKTWQLYLLVSLLWRAMLPGVAGQSMGGGGAVIDEPDEPQGGGAQIPDTDSESTEEAETREPTFSPTQTWYSQEPTGSDGEGSDAENPDVEDLESTEETEPVPEIPNGPPVATPPPHDYPEDTATTKTLRDLIIVNPNLSQFRAFLDSVGLLEGILDDNTATYTLFAPTNAAIEASPILHNYKFLLDENPPRWSGNIHAFCENHIIPDQRLTSAEIFDMVTTELPSIWETLIISQFSRKITGASITRPDVPAINGVMHIVDSIIKPKFFDHSFADLELQSEHGPDRLGRTSMVDVVDLVNGRPALGVMRETGTTYVGCRIRAFNRMGLDPNYLQQTINGGVDVLPNELMNASFATETLHNFVQYQLIPKTYYMDDIPDNSQFLVMTAAKCGHMWITKRRSRLCFNDGCVVNEPDFRSYLANNGIGYVIDRCVICSGVAMLTHYASEFTTFPLRDIAQLFIGSEWNLRDLSLSTGNGTKVTMFGALNDGFKFFTLEDTTRLSTDEWRRHLWDLLNHCLVQGEYTREMLKQLVIDNGGEPVFMTALTGEPLLLEHIPDNDMVRLAGGELMMSDIKGVDGILHFVREVPKPRSITHNTYTIAKEDPRFRTHTNYLDTVFLQEDVKRLLPLTVLYAPNEAFEGKIVDILELSSSLLENHVFKGLLFCDKLREMARRGEAIESHNGRLWSLSVTSEGQVCIDTILLIGQFAEKACITKCDILARNGIVHELDSIIVFEALRTLPPEEQQAIKDAEEAAQQAAGNSSTSDNGSRPGNNHPDTGFSRPKPTTGTDNGLNPPISSSYTSVRNQLLRRFLILLVVFIVA